MMFGQAEAGDGHSKEPLGKSITRIRMIACSQLIQRSQGSIKSKESDFCVGA